MAMKIDLYEAYDRLRWEFIEDTLVDAGFPTRFSRLIMFCISSVSMQVLWNKVPSKKFYPSRAIRQGDPISPYLFVHCIERLGHAICNQL